MNKYEYRILLFEYWNSSNYSSTGPVMAAYLWSCLLMSSAQLAQTTWGWSLCHQRHKYWDISKYIPNSNKENVKHKTAWSLFLAQWTLFWVRSCLIWRGLWWNVRFLCVKLCCVLLDKSHNWPANNSKAISLAPGHNSSFFSISWCFMS